MICKKCGFEVDVVRWQAVYPDAPVTPEVGPGPVAPEIVLKRWACPRCCRFHNEDGSVQAVPVEVLDEAHVIRRAMHNMGWIYVGGGPYPVTPRMRFRRGDEWRAIALEGWIE